MPRTISLSTVVTLLSVLLFMSLEEFRLYYLELKVRAFVTVYPLLRPSPLNFPLP